MSLHYKYTITMIIKVISPRGYCKGVVRAINIAKKARIDYPEKDIFILGMIVHNTYVTKALERLNIITIDHKGKTREELLDYIDHGVVVFTAHGIDNNTKIKATSKGLITIDASCVDVIKTQDSINSRIEAGYSIIYIGTKNHPEAMAVLSDHTNISLVTKYEDIELLNINNDKIFITNQTTMSIKEIEQIYKSLKVKYPNAIIEEEICNATRLRQEALINHSHLDLLYVVGDPLSNNSNKLKDIGKAHCADKVLLIETNQDININDLKGINSIGITSGASTPTYLTNQVIEVLQHYEATNTLIKKSIELDKII